GAVRRNRSYFGGHAFANDCSAFGNAHWNTYVTPGHAVLYLHPLGAKAKKAMIDVHQIGFSVRNRSLLNNITFSVAPGEFWAIVGANGAGKSTLIKVLSSELSPSSGSVQFFEKDLKKYKLSELARKRAVLS